MRLPSFLDFARRGKKEAVTGSAKPPRGEVGAVEDQFIAALGLGKENPDAQVQRFGLRIFEEWEVKDCHYRNCLRILKAAVLSREIDVEPYSDAEVDQRAANLIRYQIENIKGRFKRDIREILDAVSKGYTVHERVWGFVEKGEFAGSAWIEELRHKPPWCYSFQTDRTGRVTGLIQETTSGGGKREIPDWEARFLVWAYNANYENPYGRGLMSSCAWPIWFKKNGVKFLAIACEKFGMPTVKIEMPASPSKSDTEAIDKIIDTIQAATGIKVPSGFTVELLEAMRRGGDIYKQMLEWCDREISHAVLGVALATEGTDRGSGSYSLGREQIGNIFDSKIVQDLCEEAGDMVQDQMAKPVIDYNMEVEGYPRIVLRQPKTYADLDKETLQLLIDAGVEIPVSWARDRWGIPERERDKDGKPEPILKAKKPAPIPPGLEPFTKGNGPDEGTDEPDKGTSDEANMVQLAEGPSSNHPDWIKDFTEAVGNREDGYVEAAVKEVNPLIRETMSAYIDALKVAFDEGSLEAAHAIEPDLSQVRDLIYRTLYIGSLSGITDGQRMLARLGWEAPKEAGTTFGEIYWENVHKLLGQRPPDVDLQAFGSIPAPDDALAYFKGLQYMTRDVYNTYMLQGQAFMLAGVENASAARIVKGQLLQALNNGWTFEQFRASLLGDEAFMARYMPPEGSSINAHWETVFRTNMNWAYNRGRRDFWNDPDVADYVPGYRYNAILDNRVRPEHAAMDGREFAKDSPVWDEWFPPNGFNCRCYADPVTIREWKGESAKPALARTTDGKTVAVQPDEGFGRRGKAEKQVVRV